MKNPKTLLRVSVIGTVLVALCCFTPILVILLGTVGLAALTGYLDVVLLPALALVHCGGLLAVGWAGQLGDQAPHYPWIKHTRPFLG